MLKRIKVECSLENLEKARLIAARIVSKYGDRYLPIFERLQKEYEIAHQRNALKAAALQLIADKI